MAKASPRATLDDRALQGAWNILNGVLRSPIQAEKKWVIAKNDMAYYLKNLKEEGVCIQMEVNAPQLEESTRRCQENVKVDPGTYMSKRTNGRVKK